tara:strand:- start:6346 stop:7041 length:696 start_codon:yes stop_codon:yes gene_type:complete
MAKIIKKAQNGIKAKPVPVNRIKQVADSLDNVASQKMKASMNRTTKSGGSYDDMSKELNRQANKDSDNASRYRKLADEASSKKAIRPIKSKMKAGGAVKKLQNGGGTTKTKDSTDYFKNRASEAVFERGRTRDKNIINKSSISKKTQDDKSAVDKISNLNESVARQSKKGKLGYDANGKKKMKAGGMIKRADGSMSKRGLWDNIRANKGSGKKPTASMLKQEKKIKSKAKK